MQRFAHCEPVSDQVSINTHLLTNTQVCLMTCILPHATQLSSNCTSPDYATASSCPRVRPESLPARHLLSATVLQVPWTSSIITLVNQHLLGWQVTLRV